jgi:hypothetical protein
MRIFGSKREDVTGGCRKLHSEELHISCYSPDIVRKEDEIKNVLWAEHIASMGEMKSLHKVLVLPSRPDCPWGHPASYPARTVVFSPGVKRPEREVDNPPPYSTVRLRICGAIFQIVFMAWCLIKQWVLIHGVVLS